MSVALQHLASGKRHLLVKEVSAACEQFSQVREGGSEWATHSHEERDTQHHFLAGTLTIQLLAFISGENLGHKTFHKEQGDEVLFTFHLCLCFIFQV